MRNGNGRTFIHNLIIVDRDEKNGHVIIPRHATLKKFVRIPIMEKC